MSIDLNMKTAMCSESSGGSRPVVHRLRAAFGFLGGVSLGVVGANSALFLAALALGVRCPECDPWKLGERYRFWTLYFDAMRSILLLGAACALVSLPLALPRRWSAIALVVAGATFALLRK